MGGLPDPEKETQSGISQIVVLVHGIRTNGPWFELVRQELEKDVSIKVYRIRFRWLRTLEFWFPFWTRSRALKKVWLELSWIRNQHQGARMSVIAHSFGTYAIGSLLVQQPDLRFFRVLLCGSVLIQDFRWVDVSHKILDRIVNDCGTNDVWPVLAQSTTWGYGASGVHGFGSGPVHDRFHPFRHGDFFEIEFITKYWIPFITRGSVEERKGERPTSPWWFQYFAGLPLNWIIVFTILCMAILSGVNAFTNISHLWPIAISVNPTFYRNGEDMTGNLLRSDELAVNDQIRLKITTDRSCWIYVFVVDESREASSLPNEPFWCSAGAEGIILPSSGQNTSITGPVGMQRLYVIACYTPLADLEKCFRSRAPFSDDVLGSARNGLRPVKIVSGLDSTVHLQGIETALLPSLEIRASGQQPIGLIWTFNVKQSFP